MLIDGRTLTDNISADLCIVGAGPAGIALALELAGKGKRIALLESGGIERDEVSIDLGSGLTVGRDYFPWDELVGGGLGGLSQLWGGWIRPLDPLDFEKRAWVDHSGWPFGYDELEPYYRRAQKLLTGESYRYRAADWSDAVPPLYGDSITGPDVYTAVWQKLNPPTRFGHVYKADLEKAADVTVYTNSHVTRVVTSQDGGRVVWLEVATRGGNRFEVLADRFVLAAGGFGNPRLLLGSGLGGDAVGRYFMEHPHVPVARVNLDRTSSRPEFPALDKGPGGAAARLALERPKHAIKCAYALTPEAQRRLEALNVSLHLRGYSRDVPQPAVHLAAGIRQPLHTLRNMPMRGEYGLPRQAWGFLRTLPDSVGVVYERFVKRPDVLEVFAQSEQAPNPSSRVTLSDQFDELGMRRVDFDWRMSDLDKASVLAALNVLDGDLQAAGIGRLEPYDFMREPGSDWGPALKGGNHQIGTTRMSVSPNDGVVDADGLVHGVANLYVAGGSVFPAGGFSNPMLTLLATTLRLADHLKG